jgi:uroporphyrinogen-III synthase
VRVLVTRPEPDGERTAVRLRARGCDVLLAPLLRIEPVAVDLGNGPWGAIAVTSASAIRAVAGNARLKELLALPVFAVGGRTAEAARAAGFANVVSADGNKDDLVRVIAERHRGGAAVLYLAGEDRSGDLVGDLAAVGVPARMRTVYRAVAVAALPDDVRRALSEGWLYGVLHFSQRSAAIYVDRANAAGILDKALAPAHLCLSPAVAQPLISAGANDIRIAVRPEEAAVIDLVTV